MGGYDTSHHQVPVTFLPLVKDQGWYTIKLFLIWAAIGIVVYFAYARSRSLLGKAG